jgi:hypothetical protein
MRREGKLRLACGLLFVFSSPFFAQTTISDQAVYFRVVLLDQLLDLVVVGRDAVEQTRVPLARKARACPLFGGAVQMGGSS